MTTASVTPIHSHGALNRITADNIRAEMARRRISGRKLATLVEMAHNPVAERLRGDITAYLRDIARRAAAA